MFMLRFLNKNNLMVQTTACLSLSSLNWGAYASTGAVSAEGNSWLIPPLQSAGAGRCAAAGNAASWGKPQNKTK